MTKILFCSGGEDVDLYLKSAIEGVVIKWATQVNDVLTKDPSQAFEGGQNPNPSAGIITTDRIIIRSHFFFRFLAPLTKSFLVLQ